jgi:hypothetical protein
MPKTRPASESRAIFEDAVLRAYWVVKPNPDRGGVLVEEAVASTRKESGPFESDDEALVFIACRRVELHQALKDFLRAGTAAKATPQAPG